MSETAGIRRFFPARRAVRRATAAYRGLSPGHGRFGRARTSGVGAPIFRRCFRNRSSTRRRRCPAGTAHRRSAPARPRRRPGRAPRELSAPSARDGEDAAAACHQPTVVQRRPAVEDERAGGLGRPRCRRSPRPRSRSAPGSRARRARPSPPRRGLADRRRSSVAVGRGGERGEEVALSRGMSTCVSGSPKRALNSSTRGPSVVSISPANRRRRTACPAARARRARAGGSASHELLDVREPTAPASTRPCRRCSGRRRRRARACGPRRAERNRASPSQSANTDTSGPSSRSSTTTVPAERRGGAHAGLASSVGEADEHAFPGREPVRLHGHGGRATASPPPSGRRRRRALLANAFEPSIRAAAALGPKPPIPAWRSRSASPRRAAPPARSRPGRRRARAPGRAGLRRRRHERDGTRRARRCRDCRAPRAAR